MMTRKAEPAGHRWRWCFDVIEHLSRILLLFVPGAPAKRVKTMLPFASVSCSLLSLSFLLHVSCDELRQYHFFDVDEWSCHGAGCRDLRTLHGALVGEDTDETSWFFSAPPHIVRELACASAVSFRISHPEFNSKGRDCLSDFDVVIVSKSLKKALGLKSKVPSWDIMTDVTVSLEGGLQGGETGKDIWMHTDEAVAADDSDLRAVVAQASALVSA